MKRGKLVKKKVVKTIILRKTHHKKKTPFYVDKSLLESSSRKRSSSSDMEVYVTRQVSQMDYLIKRRQYSDAMDVFSIIYTEMEDADVDKHGGGILRRLWRIKKDCRDEKISAVAEKAMNDIRGRMDGIRGKAPLENAEKNIAVIAIAGLLGALFFLSPNLMGNVVSETGTKMSSILGAILLVFGISSAVFYALRKRR